jgi:hypothetical protein
MSDEWIFFNGVDAKTGAYLVPPLCEREAKDLARKSRLGAADLSDAKHRKDAGRPVLRVHEGVDPRRLDQAGWGVLFSATDPQAPAIRDALLPLLARRREQAGAGYAEYLGADGHRPNETKWAFLARHGTAPGMPAECVPYYLLIAGAPEKDPQRPEGVIPYRFEYALGVERAVGRVQFDSLEEYARYAEGVVAAESQPPRRSRRVRFFAATNEGDPATRLSTNELVLPLAQEIESCSSGWVVDPVTSGEKATRAALEREFCQPEPALLFTASHGIGLPRPSAPQDCERQRREQGALLCSDWSRSAGDPSRPVPREHYFGGEDLEALGPGARVAGLVTFHFACFGAGTPWLDDTSREMGRKECLADEAFVGYLPRKLLSHPGGGALAAIGHVERARGYSFLWPGAPRQLGVFKDALLRLLNGFPVGYAMEYFHDRYAALSVEVSERQMELEIDGTTDERQLAALWNAHADARSYVIVGDPAVRLSIA